MSRCVTCYPPMVLTSDNVPVRNELRTLRSLVTHQPCFYQKPSPHDYALSRGCYVQDERYISSGHMDVRRDCVSYARIMWMCDAKPLGEHICSSKGMLCTSDTSRRANNSQSPHESGDDVAVACIHVKVRVSSKQVA